MPRSAALDAGRLDDELSALLAEQAGRALAAVAPARAASAAPDVRAALAAAIWGATVVQGRPTPGMALLGLRYVADSGVPCGRTGADGRPPSPVRGATLGLATIALRYAWDTAASRGGLRWLAEAAPGLVRTARRADDALALASLANSLAFLAGVSRHRSLAEAALRVSMVPSSPGTPRALSFDYLNRQLVWHELAQLVLAVLPLIDAPAAGRALRRLLPASGPLEGGGGGGPPGSAGPCGTCRAPHPPLPFAALPCRHPHCYYCLAAACAADGGHKCWCGERVAAMVRVRPVEGGGES